MTADVLSMDERPYQLGLIHDHKAPEVPDLAEFALWKTTPGHTTGPLKPPKNVQLINAVRPMALNNRFGDCTIAGAVHLNQQGALVLDMPWTYCGDEVTDRTYFTLTKGADSGLQLPQVLRPWHMGEFLGQKPNGGYGFVHPKATTQVQQSIWVFGAIYMAVNLPAIAQDQFKVDGSGVWELTHTQADYQIEGGHCIVGVAYSPEGVYVVTWGGIVLVTWEWWFTYGTQAYAVVPPDFVAHNGDGRGFDLRAMDMFLPTI